MKHAIIMVWLVTFGMQSVPLYDIALSPEEEVQAQLAQISRQLTVLIDELKAFDQRALETYLRREPWQRREVWQYLPPYCPLTPDNEEAAF